MDVPSCVSDAAALGQRTHPPITFDRSETGAGQSRVPLGSSRERDLIIHPGRPLSRAA